MKLFLAKINGKFDSQFSSAKLSRSTVHASLTVLGYDILLFWLHQELHL